MRMKNEEISTMTRHLAKLARMLDSAWTWAIKALPQGTESQGENYRPEAHYMRGPGPKWRAKHTRIAAGR